MNKKQGIIRKLSSIKTKSDEDVTKNYQQGINSSSITPTRDSFATEDEDSPYFPCVTQEIKHEVDVLWDWNSPQSKQKTKKHKKRLNMTNSHQISFKRYPSNNQLKHDFDKLKEDLTALKQELAAPDHEESLILSPREEAAYKDEMTNLSAIDILIKSNQTSCNSDPEDIFNDSLDEQMIQFSQQVENELIKINDNCKTKYLTIDEKINKICHDSDPKSSSNNYPHTKAVPPISLLSKENNLKAEPFSNNGLEQPSCKVANSVVLKNKSEDGIFDDSFEGVASQIPIEDLDLLTQVVDIASCRVASHINKTKTVFPTSQSETFFSRNSTSNIAARKVEFYRTQSFEICNGILSQDKLNEIQKKRMEAEGKLKTKKFEECSDSPIKCSPEEVEKKRLQALAIRESKRQQEIIERKKQEALHRLAQSRKKNAVSVKSSLTKRL
ncbi:uncharacterized protein LOC132697410 [Cylas formicarius]|uniref:uncharacterized protein LOC132697410 n=1 Tax=Cylas formicarius TaxID=197179 RepID=UPI002958C477|nr:uncharacterized protein LOC132697410 [Cylas formicarius]